MFIETTLLLTNLILPILMIGFGMYFTKLKPKLNESGFGFRTERSTKNRMTWKFAHKYCGRLWVKYGWLCLMTTTAVMVPMMSMEISFFTISMISTLLITISAAMFLLAYFQTENQLNQRFDEQGNIKNQNK